MCAWFARLDAAFDIAEEGGIRLIPSTMLTNRQLKVSQINQRPGDSLRSRLLNTV